MRIACVNQDPGVGPSRAKGAAVHLAAVRGALSELGADVVALDLSDDGELVSRLDGLAAGGLDLVYERHALGRSTALRFARGRGIPHVLEANAPLLEEERRWREREVADETARAEAELFRTSHVVFAVSEAVAKYARSQGASDGSVLVRPNAVDPELFRPRGPSDPKRAQLVPEGRFAIGFHGRLRPWHGLRRVAEATARLLEDGVDAHVVAVGVGEFEAELDGLVPPNRRTILGWCPPREVAHVVATFDVLPLGYSPDHPCYFSPLKLLEAMAAGVVPVVPDLGDLPEQAGGAHCSVCYSAGNVESLSQALGALARDPDRRASMATAGRGWALGRTWAGIAREILALAGAPRA